jgi:peptidoglycan hydrolase-like protein with peptidoglycan-binding domain
MIQEVLDPHAKSAVLTSQDSDGGADEEYEFDLGHLDPVEQTDGLQARLKNLGYLRGDITGEIDDDTKAAIEIFQKAAGLAVTGKPDQATRDALKSAHEA